MSQKSIERHTVQCPHCQRDVLDHMTECPFCKGELSPRGYDPRSAEKYKKVRRVTNIIGFAVAVAIILSIVLARCS